MSFEARFVGHQKSQKYATPSGVGNKLKGGGARLTRNLDKPKKKKKKKRKKETRGQLALTVT